MENQEKVISLNDKVIESLKKDKSREVKISVDGMDETFIVIFTTTREFEGETRNYVALLDKEGTNLIFAKYNELTKTDTNLEFSGSLTDIEDVEEYRQLTEVFLEYMSDLEHE